MSFLNPEMFNKAKKRVTLKSISLSEGKLPEKIKDSLLYLLNGEVQRQDDVIVQICSLGLPLGHTVIIKAPVEYFGKWDLTFEFKLADCKIHPYGNYHIDYIFELKDVWDADYVSGERWDEEMDCYDDEEVNELLELPNIELVLALLHIKYGRHC